MKKLIIIILLILNLPLAYSAGWGEKGWGEKGWGGEVAQIADEPAASTSSVGGGGGGDGGSGALVNNIQIINDTALNDTVRRYDVIVKVEKGMYRFNETVKAAITIENKGDKPDEDTVLIYYLSNPVGKEFGKTRDQFLEIPMGKTKLLKEIKLPEYDLNGEWRFNIQYYTIFQSTIIGFDPFEVKEDFTFVDYIQNSLNKVELTILVIIIIIFVYHLDKIARVKQREI